MPPIGTPRKLDDDEAVIRAREREAIREGIDVGVRSVLKTGIPAAVLLPLLTYAMRSTIVAASKMPLGEGLGAGFTGGLEPLMPALLFAMFGGIYGALAGWRLTSGAGLVGRYGLLVGAAAVVVLVLIGALASFVVFEEVPTMFWICMLAMAVCGLGGITYFTRIAG